MVGAVDNLAIHFQKANRATYVGIKKITVHSSYRMRGFSEFTDGFQQRIIVSDLYGNSGILQVHVKNIDVLRRIEQRMKILV
jgi:hypothetical protein